MYAAAYSVVRILDVLKAAAYNVVRIPDVLYVTITYIGDECILIQTKEVRNLGV